MSKQDKQEPNNQQTLIEDLTVSEDETAEVKGGFSYDGLGRLTTTYIGDRTVS